MIKTLAYAYITRDLRKDVIEPRVANVEDKDFLNYNIEQQAEIIAYYYDISIRKTRSDYYQYRDIYYNILK